LSLSSSFTSFVEDHKVQIIAGFLCVGVAGAAYYKFADSGPEPESVEKRSLCGQNLSRSTIILVDQSDPLALENDARVMEIMRSEGRVVSRGSSLVLASFSGAVHRRVMVHFQKCSPGRGSEIDRREVGRVKQEWDWNREFIDPLENTIGEIAHRRATRTDQSYIADTIASAVTDGGMRFNGRERRLLVLTDGLENTATSRPYVDGRVRLARPREQFLAGVDFEFIELAPDVSVAGLQTYENRLEWRQWACIAGAKTVTIRAPGLRGNRQVCRDVP